MNSIKNWFVKKLLGSQVYNDNKLIEAYRNGEEL